MLKVKIINIAGLDYEDEEKAINKELEKLNSEGYLLDKITYRQNSVVFEYLE